MKTVTWKWAIAAAIVSATWGPSASAELVTEEIQSDEVVTDSASADAQDADAALLSALGEKQNVVDTTAQAAPSEVVVIKRKKKPAAPKVKYIIEEEEDDAPAVVQQQAAPAIDNRSQAVANASVGVQVNPAPTKSLGNSLDAGVQAKMDSVREQFEQAILRSLDKIKVSVDDGSAAQTTVVQDNIVGVQAAPSDTYLSLDKAPVVADDLAVDGKSEAKKDESLQGRVRIAPVAGWTSLSSDIYNVDSRYTAGVNIEVDIGDDVAAVAGYSYSQFDIALANTNPFYATYGYGFAGQQNKLEYNQNVFDLGIRYYLLPKQSRFRFHVGAGMGYNKGYLNYNQNSLRTFTSYNNADSEDYEVTSFLGQLETGGEIQLSKTVAVGGLFKYNKVLSSSENRPLNNNGFIMNGYNRPYYADDKQIAGNSIADSDFYSILATLKVSF